MGKDVERDTFDELEYARFAQRLEQCLSALEELLDRPGFGVGPATIGAELELFLVDHAGRPLPRNQAVRAASADPRVTVELDRFNLELNASPVRLAGRPFTALSRELRMLLDRVADAAGALGGRIVLIGILPTLRRSDLGPGALTDLRRYSALNNRLRQVRHGPFRIRIEGDDSLELVSDDVSVEGANTSFQLHLRVNPAEFTRHTTRPSWPSPRCWPWPVTRPRSSATVCGKRPASPCANNPSTTATPAARGLDLLAWRSVPDGCGTGRRSCLPKAWAAPATTTRPWRQ